MVSWALAEHGDSHERAWATTICPAFPNYERFWAAHVVPLTYRIVDPRDILVRASVRKELEDLASSHYAVFVNLAKCHEMLGSDGETFARREVYNFYSRLYSVRETAEKFLAAVKRILREYGGVCIPDKRRRLAFYDQRKPGLAARVEEAFEKRTRDYRTEQVHACGFITVGGKIPRREYLPRWTRLGELDRLRLESNPGQRVATEFVDSLEQAADDLSFVEAVLNDLWDVTLGELDRLSKAPRYRADQRAGGSAGAVGADGGFLQINLSSQSASGMSGPQGPQGQL